MLQRADYARAMNADVAARIVEHELRPGEWVAAARAEAARRDGRDRAYSQMDLAAAIGRDRNTVQRWERAGIDMLSWAGVLSILGLEIDWTPEAPSTRARRPR